MPMPAQFPLPSWDACRQAAQAVQSPRPSLLAITGTSRPLHHRAASHVVGAVAATTMRGKPSNRTSSAVDIHVYAVMPTPMSMPSPVQLPSRFGQEIQVVALEACQQLNLCVRAFQPSALPLSGSPLPSPEAVRRGARAPQPPRPPLSVMPMKPPSRCRAVAIKSCKQSRVSRVSKSPA